MPSAPMAAKGAQAFICTDYTVGAISQATRFTHSSLRIHSSSSGAQRRHHLNRSRRWRADESGSGARAGSSAPTRDPAGRRAVQRVARHRMSDARQMHADLVRPAGPDPDFEESEPANRRSTRYSDQPRGPRPAARSCESAAPGRARWAARSGPLSCFTVPCTSARYTFSTCRPENCAASRWCAASFFATSSTPLVKRSSRWTIPGRSAPPTPESAAKRCSSAFTSVPECTPAPRVHHHSGRLVDRHQVVVLVEHRERNVFRGGVQRGRLRGLHVDAVPGAHLRARRAPAAPFTRTRPFRIHS